MLPGNYSEMEVCLLQTKEEYFEVLYKRYKETSRKEKTVIINVTEDFPSFIAAADYMIISVRVLNSQSACQASKSVFSKMKRKE
jgi:hypothetical protein